MAVALNVPWDALLFDEDEGERKPPEELTTQFEAIAQFNPEEKKILMEVMEGLIVKHEAKRRPTGT